MRSIPSAALVLLVTTACAPAPESPPPPPQPAESLDDTLGSSLFSPPAEQKIRREHLLASELADTLEQISGIEDARVHLSLADNSLGSRNPDAPGRAAVLVVHQRGRRPDPAAIRGLVAAALPEISEDQVAVVFTERAVHEQRTGFIGPLEVVSTSLTTARVIFGLLIGTCFLMALALILAGLKIRQIRRTPRQ